MVGTIVTFAPWRRNHAATGTQALRVGAITTVSSLGSPRSRSVQSRSRSFGRVKNLRPDQMIDPSGPARDAWCAARQARSMPNVMLIQMMPFVGDTRNVAWLGAGSAQTFRKQESTARSAGSKFPNRDTVSTRRPRGRPVNFEESPGVPVGGPAARGAQT